MHDESTREDQPLNREQRRKARFRPNAGRADPHAVPLEEGSEPPDAAARDAVAPDEAALRESVTGTGDSDPTRLTGAGTGGAIEDGSRVRHHEGTHLGNQPNS
jgi:hypothetical protein